MPSVVFLFLMQFTYAQNMYYVSSSTGDDTNDGLSELAAWKTLDKVSIANIMPGALIIFKAGDTFVGQLNPNMREAIIFS